MKACIANLFLTISIALVPALPAIAVTDVAPAVLPAEAFYHLPLIQNPQISPDGTHVVAIKNSGNFSSIMVLNLATGETFYPTKSDNKELAFNWVRWANNDRLLLSISFADTLRGVDTALHKTRLLSVDAKRESQMIAVVQPSERSHYASLLLDNVVGLIANDPDSVLMAILDEERQGNPGVYKVDLATGKRKQVKKAEVTTHRWFADMDGVVRAGSGGDERNETFQIKVLDPQTNSWVVAWTSQSFLAPDVFPLGFGGNASDFYVLADYKGHKAIYKADLSRAGYPLTLVLSDEKRDLYGTLIYSAKRHEALGISYTRGGETYAVFWNEEIKKLQAGLAKAMPGAQVTIVSVSDDLRKYIVFTQDATNPGSYLHGNRDTKELLPLADTYPELDANVLVNKERLSFKSRNGSELTGFLSRAKNTSLKTAPLIVLPPDSHQWNVNNQFNIFAAFLVSRGYNVFQPDINPVHLYNGAFVLYSIGRQGLAMQGDIEDGIKYLIDNKIATPGKIGIMGAEYGGFAAMMGAVNTPDLFACAISIGGISDITKIQGSRTYWRFKNSLKDLMGTEIDQRLNAAPILNAEKIKAPVLLIHGSEDTDVRVQHSREMAEELKRLHKTYEYLELKEGNEDLIYLPHRKQTFEAIEAFLKKYLPVG